MAREFGTYNVTVPMGVTWEESITLTDANGVAINLTGYDIRAQIRTERRPERDDDTGLAVNDPVMEITTVDYYDSDPAWTLVEGFVNDDPTSGTFTMTVAAVDTWGLSPDNSKLKLYWDIRLVNTVTGYSIPVVAGSVTALPGTTI